MKKMKFIITCVIGLSLLACTQDEENVNSIYDNDSPTGVGFSSTQVSVIVPMQGITQTVPVQATTTSTSMRTFPVMVNTESNGLTADYTLGVVTIPANEYDGSFDVTFGNFANLPEGQLQTLIVDLNLPEGVFVVGSESITFEYVKSLICNDLELLFIPDNFASENSWEVTDSAGATVASGGPYTDMTAGMAIVENFTLADGDYNFTFFDSYGDGLFDQTNTGSYVLSCSIITHASGEGASIGASQSTDFSVN